MPVTRFARFILPLAAVFLLVAPPAAAATRFSITTDIYTEIPSIPGWFQPDDRALTHLFDGSPVPADLKAAMMADKSTRRLLSYMLAAGRSSRTSTIRMDVKGGPPWTVTLVLVTETTIETTGDVDRTRRMTSRTPIAVIRAVPAPRDRKPPADVQKDEGRPEDAVAPPGLIQPILPGPDYGLCAEDDDSCSARVQTRLLAQPYTDVEKLLIERDVRRTLALGYRINEGQINREDLERSAKIYKQRLEAIGGSEFPSGALDEMTRDNFGTNVSRMQSDRPSLPEKPGDQCKAQFADTAIDVIPTLECARVNFNYRKWVKHDFLAAWSRIPLINPQNLPYIGALAAAHVANVADRAAADKVYQGVWALMWMDRVASWNAAGNSQFVREAVAVVRQSHDERRVLLDWLANDSGTLDDFRDTRDLLYDEYLSELLPDAEWADSHLPKTGGMPDKITWATNLVARGRRLGLPDRTIVDLALAAPDGATARQTLVTLKPWLKNHPVYSKFGDAVELLSGVSGQSLRP